MQHDEPGDIISESLAIRRGMQYQVKVVKVKGEDTRIVTSANQPNPFLIDMLLDRRIINHDHHFYGVQLITMRQLFLKDVSVKVGMLQVKREDSEQAYDKPIPMEDNDYLKVLRAIRTQRWKEIIMAVCDVNADHRLCPQLERIEGSVSMAFSQLGDAVVAVWEKKKAENESRIKNQCEYAK